MNKKLNFGTLLLVMALVLIPQGSAATLDGAAIYASKCQMCHGTLATHSMIPSGITADQITASFAPGGKMDGRGVTLAAGEAQAIADAITPPVADTTKPVITAPADVTVVAVAVLPMTVDIGTATATDNSGIAPVITNDAPAKFGLGVTTVTWTATDVSGNFATATQKVTVTAPVQTPVLSTVTITPLSPTVNKSKTLQFLSHPFDQFGNPFIGAISSWTSSNLGIGTVDTNGLFTAIGQGTTTLTVTAVNGSDVVSNRTVITVNAPETAPINQAPVAVNDSYNTNENTVLNIAAPGVLSNDNDANGDSLTAIKVSDPTNGLLTLNANGSFTYTPAANFNGTDSFTYQANDSALDSNIATVLITVTPTSSNPPPTGNEEDDDHIGDHEEDGHNGDHDKDGHHDGVTGKDRTGNKD